MNEPKPPFHSVAEELLYAIYQTLTVDAASMTPNDINTLAKLNAILTDAQLVSTAQLTNTIQALTGNAPAPGNSLQKLYELITTLQHAFAGLNALKAEDLDTLTEINNLITDADVASATDLTNAVAYLEGVIANLPVLSTVIYNFSSSLFTEQAIAFQGLISTLSQNFTDELITVIYETALDGTPKNWIVQADLNAVQAWINSMITGSQLTGTKYWIKCAAIYKSGHSGQAQNLFTYRQTNANPTHTSIDPD